MNLKTQIISLIFSFLYGFLFSICTNLNYKFLFLKNIIFKIIITFIYVIDFALLYFFILRIINDGVVHNYFLLFIVFGYLVSYISLNKYIIKFKRIVKKCLKSVKKDKV